jgi:hypothetical protein
MSFSYENQDLSYLLGRFSTAIIFYREFFCKTNFTPKCVTIVLSLIIIIKLDDTTPTPVGKPKF